MLASSYPKCPLKIELDVESETMCIINNICWKISLACQQKCGTQDMTFFHGFTNTREGCRAGNFTLLGVRIEKQRGKPFFQAPRQTRAEGTFWSSERPEVCCCGTGEHCCPFHPAQQTGCPDCPRGRRQRVAPEKFTVPPGASRDAAVLALRGRGAESWTRRRRGSWRGTAGHFASSPHSPGTLNCPSKKARDLL